MDSLKNIIAKKNVRAPADMMEINKSLLKNNKKFKLYNILICIVYIHIHEYSILIKKKLSPTLSC